MPTLPCKPQDKGKVELAVLILERWVLARLRHHNYWKIKVTLFAKTNHNTLQMMDKYLDSICYTKSST